jgi:endonuclease YncB( thermonuclease family)
VKWLKSILIIVLLLTPALAIGAEFTGKAVRVIDGDSISVIHDGKSEQVRLYGIDCPEKGQAYGNEPSRLLHHSRLEKK